MAKDNKNKKANKQKQENTDWKDYLKNVNKEKGGVGLSALKEAEKRGAGKDALNKFIEERGLKIGTAAKEAGYGKQAVKPEIKETPVGTFADIPDTTSIFSGILDVLSNNQATELNAISSRNRVDEINAEGLSNQQIAKINLQGTRLQSEAAKYAAAQSAGATRFASTEATRGQIETQRLASKSAERQIGLTGAEQRATQQQLLASQERQIGLTGEQERLTTLTRGEQERLGITATGEQQRLTQAEQISGEQETQRQRFAGEAGLLGVRGKEERRTQAQLLAGQERQIGLTGEQQRATQRELLAGQERQIGLTGSEERRTQAERLAGEERQIGLRGAEERLGIETTGREQRATQSELLAGQERQIGLTGEQERATQRERFAGETGLEQTRGIETRETIGRQAREQRETELQQELYRRYREEKDYSQARAAFRS